MADIKTISRFKYKIEMAYTSISRNRVKEIPQELIKSMIIDHNYDKNNMPIIYCTLGLDKAMVDDMILNVETSIITLALYKYDDYSESPLDMECIRKQFTYFLPSDININDQIDYNEVTEEEMKDATLRTVSLGLLCIDHINQNKKSFNATLNNATMYDAVKYCTSHINNVLIEPFIYNDTFKQLIIPPIDSLSKTLRFLNDYRVFYPTPYRYYLDFNTAYLISSSGRAIPTKDEKYNSVIINIHKVLSDEANDPGVIINSTKSSYEVGVNHANTTVYNNSIVGKSKTSIKGITSSGSTSKTLNYTSSYTTDKVSNIRINNDNKNMIDNLSFDMNSNKVLVSINKNDLDTSIFTINKKIVIHHIDKYQEYNGDYLIKRKQELFIKEGDSFLMNTILNFRKIEY